MKKTFFKVIAVPIVLFLLLFAMITAAQACWVGAYQPKVPKSLLN